jgi:hypothetical protein
VHFAVTRVDDLHTTMGDHEDSIMAIYHDHLVVLLTIPSHSQLERASSHNIEAARPMQQPQQQAADTTALAFTS